MPEKRKSGPRGLAPSIEVSHLARAHGITRDQARRLMNKIGNGRRTEAVRPFLIPRLHRAMTTGAARSVTPPSEVIRPPSNAAVIFLLATAGKANGRNLSLAMAGVVRHDRVT
jgi:hypothetical protein